MCIKISKEYDTYQNCNRYFLILLQTLKNSNSKWSHIVYFMRLHFKKDGSMYENQNSATGRNKTLEEAFKVLSSIVE